MQISQRQLLGPWSAASFHGDKLVVLMQLNEQYGPGLTKLRRVNVTAIFVS